MRSLPPKSARTRFVPEVEALEFMKYRPAYSFQQNRAPALISKGVNMCAATSRERQYGLPSFRTKSLSAAKR